MGRTNPPSKWASNLPYSETPNLDNKKGKAVRRDGRNTNPQYYHHGHSQICRSPLCRLYLHDHVLSVESGHK